MQLVGHRGARFEAPENTIAGFKYALGIGIDSFELDVHLTKDGELAVIHDATVDRTTDGSGAVSELSMAEIRCLDARSIFPDWPEPCTIPTLAEVLDVIGSVPYVEVEIKTDLPERIDAVVSQVVELIRSYRMVDRVFLTSFDLYALEVAQDIAPDTRRGLIARWDTDQCRHDAERLGVSLAGFPYATGSDKLLAWAKSAGLRVTGWPTNDEAALAQARRWGVDAVCTDAPTLLRSLLVSST
jgi:glycerophosphoryl diester phosphodiesterase